MIVVDASVVAKWLLPEAGSDEALALQVGPHRLLAPDLIRLEVCAAITRRARDKDRPIPAEAAKQRCDKWLGLLDAGVVVLVPEHELLADAIRLSLEVRHPLQDCLYLAVAIRAHAPLITADRGFHDRARPLYNQISLLTGRDAN